MHSLKKITILLLENKVLQGIGIKFGKTKKGIKMNNQGEGFKLVLIKNAVVAYNMFFFYIY